MPFIRGCIATRVESYNQWHGNYSSDCSTRIIYHEVIFARHAKTARIYSQHRTQCDSFLVWQQQAHGDRTSDTEWFFQISIITSPRLNECYNCSTNCARTLIGGSWRILSALLLSHLLPMQSGEQSKVISKKTASLVHFNRCHRAFSKWLGGWTHNLGACFSKSTSKRGSHFLLATYCGSSSLFITLTIARLACKLYFGSPEEAWGYGGLLICFACQLSPAKQMNKSHGTFYKPWILEQLSLIHCKMHRNNNLNSREIILNEFIDRSSPEPRSDINS